MDSILITGSKGLLGKALVSSLKPYFKIIEADLPEYSISSYKSMLTFFKYRIQNIKYLINCAAYTDVPKAEIERQKAYLLNGSSLGILSKICLDYGVHLIHFSTDFVFDGNLEISEKYKETDIPNPQTYYGITKYEGEKIIQKKLTSEYTIFRLQWLYGNNNKSFFMKLYDKSKTESFIKIVDYEFGSPCSVDFVSQVIRKCVLKKDLRSFKGRLYHLTHNDSCSRLECAKYFLNKIEYKGKVLPLTVEDYADPIKRPKNGIMCNKQLSKNLAYDLNSWKKDLDNFIEGLKNNNA